MRMSLKGSLARRILVSMLLLALVPLMIMAVQGLHCSHQAVVELEYTHLQSILAARRAQLDAWIEERESDLRLSCFMSCGGKGCTGLANHMVPEHFDSVRANIDLFELDKPLYESLAVYDADWRRIGQKRSTTHHGEGELLDSALRQTLSTATGIVASATHSHEDEHMGLHMGYPLQDGGNRLGYIVVNVNIADTLNAILRDRTGLGESGRLYLLSTDGRYVTSPEDDSGLVGQIANIPPEIQSPQGSRVLTYPDAFGTSVLGTSATVPKFGWVLVAEVSQSEALGWLQTLVHRAIGTGFVTFIAVWVLASRFSRKLGDPLRQLAQTARRITSGSHSERVGNLEGSEAQEVGQAVNEMLDTLAEAQQKVVQSASLAAIGELSASVVHEMRNPLSSIKINLQALRKKVGDDANYSELADIASAQALRLERMLSELLSFGKPIDLDRADVPPEELMEQSVTGLQDLAEAKQIRLSVKNALQDQRLYVDREQMRRALENLVKNAIEASPEGGDVVVETKALGPDEPFAEIHVRDQGTGIPGAIRDKLFLPFVTTRGEGTGLGLANVKKIIEMHEGGVRVESPPEGGALFVLRVPLRMPANE